MDQNNFSTESEDQRPEEAEILSENHPQPDQENTVDAHTQEPAAPVTVTPEPPRRSPRGLRWLIGLLVLLIVFAAGFAIGYFNWYVPASQSNTELQTDLSKAQEELDSTTEELRSSETSLAEARQQLESSRTDLSSSESQLALLTLENHILTARLAISERAIDRAALAIILAQSDVSDLQAVLQDPSMAESFETRLEAAAEALAEERSAAAANTLDDLLADIDLLESVR